MKRRHFLKLGSIGLLGTSYGSTLNQIVTRSSIDRLYDNSLVIDALSLGRSWDSSEFKALKDTGYSGIHTSLANKTWDSALSSIRDWNQRIEDNPDIFLRALVSSHFLQAKEEKRVAVLYGHQNATMIEDKIDRLDTLHQLGTRCIQLTYNERNLIGDGCTERTNAGLSDFGLLVVKRMNKLGLIIDLSHCGKKTTYDAIRYSNAPPCFTHTMCEALYPGHPRAKTDDELEHIARNGGMIGITALGYFVGSDPGGKTNIETYLDHIDHAVKLVGVEHVGLSSDFQVQGIRSWATKENWYEPRLKSFKPSYNVKWPPWIPELDSTARFLKVTYGLFKRGYSDSAIRKILGLNWMRYFEQIIGL